MRSIIFVTILVLFCSCGQSVLEKRFNNKTFSRDTIQLKKELDEDTFLMFKTFMKDQKSKSFNNLKYRTLVIMSGSHRKNQLIKELVDIIKTKKKMICSKRWEIKKSKTFVSVKTMVSEYKKVKADNMVFEKGNKSISFKEDNTFEQIEKKDAEVVKGKWQVSSNNFSFDGNNYRINSFSEKRILLTKTEKGSNDGVETIITYSIEFLALED